MTVSSQPTPLPPPVDSELQKQRSVRRALITVAGVIVVAGIVLYATALRPAPSIPTPQDTAPTADSPATAKPIIQQDAVVTDATQPAAHDLDISQFVGSSTCADCHPDIAEAYSDHPMALTLAKVADASAIEVIADAGTTEFETQGCRYRIERDGDRMIHTEFMTDNAGNTIYEQAVDIHYSVGSGANARSYLIDRGGLMFESPLTWYVDKQKWDLSPGYENDPRERFNRRVTDDCVQCHSGLVAAVGDGTTNTFRKEPFPEHGIGCERCHGPGKQHVAKFSADDAGSEDDLFIVNPARLDKRRQESVCYQCHMEGKRRILRKGKSFHDFQAGMSVEEIWTVFVSSTPFEADGRARFTSQVEQMHGSACFKGSDGEMTCTSCHDPHRSPRPEERADFYRTRCNSCHSDNRCSKPIEEREAAPAYNSCIHCHMPTVGSSNIPHTSQSDHRVLRDPFNDTPVIQQPQPGNVWAIFDNSDQRMPKWEAQRAKAIALSDQAVNEQDRQMMKRAVAALEQVLARDPGDVSVLKLLGYLYSVTGNFAKARSWYESALRVAPRDEMSLKNHAFTAFRTGAVNAGLRSYASYVEINNWDATMYAPYVRMLAASGNLQAALNVAERGLQLDPTRRGLREVTVKLHERLGNTKDAASHRQTLEFIKSQLDPWDKKRLESRQK